MAQRGHPIFYSGLFCIFYICEYLGITPSEFFDIDSKNPTRLNDVIKDLKRLNDKQLETIAALIRDIVKD